MIAEDVLMQRLSTMSATELDASKPTLEPLVAVMDKDKLKCGAPDPFAQPLAAG